MSLLEAEGLTLPGRLAETALALESGTLACLVGPNGSGKTSLLHALAGIGEPAGTARIDGVSVRALAPAERPRALAYLPAARDLVWPLRAADLIALGGGGADGVAWAVTALELAPFLERRLDRLSTGERSRVLIARALAARPRLLLLDEPISNLDPLWQIRLMDLLRREVRSRGAAALVAIHDLDHAARWADRLIVMNEGRIVADARPATVLASSTVAQVFGIEKTADGVWRPRISPPADPRSSQ